MADTNANIRVNIDTAKAQSELAALQAQITSLNKSMTAQQTKNGISFDTTGAMRSLQGVRGEIVQFQDAASRLNKTLAGNSIPKVGQSFKNLQGIMKGNAAATTLAARNAKALSAQYKVLGTSAAGTTTALKTYSSAQSQANMATLQAQQMSLMTTRALDQLGTATLNLGKNMQWAGRQLMVGFTVPLTIFGALSIAAFKDVERQIIDLQKVYGDFSTSAAETERVTQAVRELASELTALGYTAKDSLALAADAAAIGFKGQELIEVTRKATEMAALGMMTQAEALNTVISLNSAFGVSVENLGGSLDYLNAVENETILSLQDMSEAIPITATAIQGLGGDVQDLAVFLTAMREGGINANEGANALKTSLARLISPTRQAQQTAESFGISLQQIVSSNEGDLMGMIMELSGAMQGLSDLQQQQLLSDVFGKRQFARMGALFRNLADDTSQAAKAMDLANMSAEDLALNTQRELAVLEASPVMQLTAAFEDLKLAIAPIGELFAGPLTKVLEFAAKLAEGFNNLPDVVKTLTAGFVGFIGIVVPGLTMLAGLTLNLVGSLVNAAARIKTFFSSAGSSTQYLATEELEAKAAAEQLETAQLGVNAALERQAVIISSLTAQYNALSASMRAVPGSVPGSVPGAPVQRRNAGGPILKLATGGKVGGYGSTDKVPALLTPGEFVVNKKQSQKHSGFLSALNSGSVKGFSGGGPTEVAAGQSGRIVVAAAMSRSESAELSAQIRALATAVEGDAEAERQLVARIQSLVDLATQNARERTGKEDVSYEEIKGARKAVGDKEGPSDVWSRERQDRGLGVLLPSAGRHQTEADALKFAGTGKDKQAQAHRLHTDSLSLAKTLEANRPKVDAATQSLIDEIVTGLNDGSVEVGAAIDRLFEETKGENARKAVGLGKKTPGRSEAAHAVDDYTLSPEEVQQFSRGHSSQRLVDIAGPENVEMKFMKDLVFDMPPSINQELSGAGATSGLAVKESFAKMIARGEEMPGDTMKKQWLDTRTAKGISPEDQAAYDSETAEGIAQIEAAERRFLDKVMALDDDAVVVEGALNESQEGVVSLNTMIDTDILPTLQATGDAMAAFLERIKKFGSDMRLSVTPDGMRNLEASPDADVKGSNKVFVDGKRFDLGQQWTGGIKNNEDVERMRRIVGASSVSGSYEEMRETNYSNKSSKNFPTTFFGGGQGKNTAAFKSVPELEALVMKVNEGTMSLSSFNAELAKMPEQTRLASMAALEGTQAMDYMEASANEAVQALTRMGGASSQAATSLQAQFQAGDISMDAYIQGLRTAAEQAVVVGRETGQNVDEGLRAFLGIASPSRLAIQRGKEWIQGLLNGVRSRKTEVMAAGSQTGDALDDGLQSGYGPTSPFGKGMSGANPYTPKPSQKTTESKETAGQVGMLGNKSMMAGMAMGQLISMTSMFATTIGDADSEMAKTMQKFGMLGGQVMSMASMLGPAGPIIGAVVGGLVIAGSAIYGAWRDHVNGVAEEAFKLGSALGGAADAADKMSLILGKATAAQRQSMLGLTEEDKEKYSEYTRAFESESGKALIDELNAVTGSERQMLAEQYLSAAIANEQLTKEEAETFAKALGAQLQDEALGAGLARSVAEIAEKGLPSSQQAKNQAEKRDDAIADSKALQGDMTALKDYSKALGAAQQGTKAWTTVIATSREDYANGTISYNEYIETMQTATQAQQEYANVLFDLAGKSPDPRATKKAQENAMLLSGKTQEEIDARNEMLLAAGDTARYGEDRGLFTKGSFATNPIGRSLLSIAEIPQKQFELGQATGESINEAGRQDGGIFRNLGQVDLPGMDKMFQQSGIAGAVDAGAEERARIEQEGVQFANAIMAFGYSFEESAQLATEIINDQNTAFSKAFRKAKEANLTDAQATDVATLMNNAEKGAYGEEFLGREGLGRRTKLQDTAAKVVRQGGTASQLDNIMQGYTGEEADAFLNQTNSMNSKQAFDFVNAMDALSTSVGPKTRALMQETFAEMAKAGDDLGPTNEALSEMSGYLNNNDEATERWVKYIETKNGKTDDDALTEANNRLREFQGMDKSYLLKIGIDVEQPEGGNGLLGEEFWDADKAAQAEDYVMSQQEGWQQDFAGAAVMGAGNFELVDGEAVKAATEKSLNDIALASAELNDAVAAMGDEDIEVQKQATIDFIMTSAEGQGIDIDAGGAQAMIDDIIARSGLDAATFYSMPADDIAKALNFAVVAEGATQAAMVFDQAAQVAIDSGDAKLYADMKKQANSFRNLAKLSNESVSSSVTSGLSRSDTTGGSNNSGGGGGGGKESNWLLDLEETFEENKKVLKRLKKLQEETTGLSDEIMQALAEDEDAYNKFKKDGFKEGKVKKWYYGNMQTDARKETEEMERTKNREQEVKNSDLDYFTQEQIIADPKLLEMYTEGNKKQAKWAREEAERRAEAETTTLDRLERQYDIAKQQNDLLRQGMELTIAREEYNKENEFFSTNGDGRDRAEIMQEEAELAAQIKVIELETIKPLRDQIEAKQDLIKEKEREFEINEERIEDLQDEVEIEQRRVEDMQRALEIRQREGQMLDHDLKLMSWREEEINEAYDKRIEALDKTLQINEAIAQSQQDQLGLADALSRGDIGAAAQAAAQMQQNAAQASADQYRSQLERARDNQLGSLKGAESGLTREQIEERQRELGEDEYYTNLAIRDIEDEIYNLNRQIRDEQDIIDGYKDSIKTYNEEIRDLEWDIYDAEKAQLDPLRDKQDANALILAQADYAVTKAGAADKIALARFDRNTNMWNMELDYMFAKGRFEEEFGKELENNAKRLKQNVRLANEFNKSLKTGKGNANIKLGKLQDVSLAGITKEFNFDVSEATADLQKAFDEYSFGVVPNYVIPDGSPTQKMDGIMDKEINNSISTYNVTVNAGSNSSADEIASAFDREIRKLDNANLRRQ